MLSAARLVTPNATADTDTDMVWIAERSRTITPLPGDIVFTGTAGVGVGRDPERFLQPSEELVSWIEGIGRDASDRGRSPVPNHKI